MKIISKIIVILGILGLISVRVLEDKIFYDPFLDYFHKISKNAIFPDFVWGKLILSYLFRFLLNFIFSLLIVHFLFMRKYWTIQAGAMILLVFIITFPLYIYCIYDEFQVGHLFTFYMRRFVIQPLIVLLIIPLFYYRKHIERRNKA